MHCWPIKWLMEDRQVEFAQSPTKRSDYWRKLANSLRSDNRVLVPTFKELSKDIQD
jgi:hypothetical protein